MVCINCKTIAHMGKTCEENKNKYPKGVRQLDKFAKKYNLKKCSHCKTYVEKSHGCNSMKCYCGHIFCYACGASNKNCNCL